MTNENVYIALILYKTYLINVSSINDVILLFNKIYPKNTLVIEKYLTDGSKKETDLSLDDFINKYPSGKRITISVTSSQLIYCSSYFQNKNLNILSLSLSATSNILQKEKNILTYAPYNKYAVMNNFLIYQDYQMKYVHVLYQKNTTNDIYKNDYLNQINIQANLLNISVLVSFFESGKFNYNIKENSMVIIIAETNDLINDYITPEFIKNFPKNSFIICTDANTDITDIFGDIPTFIQTPTNINFTLLSRTVYNTVKNNPLGFDYTVYPLYDILFVLNNFTINSLEITKENYINVNPYGSSPPAWLLNSYLSPILNGSPYGKYQYTFTKDVIINKNKNLFLKYYSGGQEQLPDSFSIFKIIGITQNNPSLIDYDEADYYKIYDCNNNLVCVRFNNNITNFPFGKNINSGKTNLTKFIYRFNNEGYFSYLRILYNNCFRIPEVNETMSKKTIKLKYIE